MYSSLRVRSDWVIRSLFNVLLGLFQNSLTKPPEDIDSPGRSGARMMMSHDKKYFIKTLVSEEVEQLHLILKQYHQVCIMEKTYTVSTGTYHEVDLGALSISPAKPVSPALPVLPLMESTSPAGNCGNVNKHCQVFRRRCRRGDVNGKHPRYDMNRMMSAVMWTKYCRYSIKHYIINQSNPKRWLLYRLFLLCIIVSVTF